MTFIVDENLSQELTKGLRGFGEDVHHIVDEFGRGVKDTDWLKEISGRGWSVITRDRAIRRRPAEIEALRQYRIGAFFLGGKQLSRWQLITQIVRAWPLILEANQAANKPFIFIVNRSGTNLDRLE